MNPYARHLTHVPSEIAAFARTEEGRKWDRDWYQRVEHLALQAGAQDNAEDAEGFIDIISRMIIDSGPLTAKFSPSLSMVIQAMQARRSR